MLTFTVTGSVDNIPFPSNLSPDGGSLANHAAENGISGFTAPLNSLVGVFLSDAQPNLSPPPADFPYLPSGGTVSPQVQQVFFIGDGLTGTGSGAVQQFVVPRGATRLFLGTWDGYEWNNNFGSFGVIVGISPTPVQSPTGHYYRCFLAPGISWADAKAAAQAATSGCPPAHLATLTSAEEDAFVQLLRREFVQAQGDSAIFGQEFWVGGSQLRDQATPGTGWLWENNEGPISGVNGGASYANWNTSEPNDYGKTIGIEDNEENFLAIGWNGLSVWNDEGTLDNILGYVVEYEVSPTPVLGPNGHYYQCVTAAGISWIDANAAAQAATFGCLQGHLATIGSAEEDAFVNCLRQGLVDVLGDGANFGQEFWVGGFQLRDQATPGTGWFWVHNDGPIPGVNGSAVYANWDQAGTLFSGSATQPDDCCKTIGIEDNEENYLGIGLGSVFGWNDEGNFSLILGYVIEYELPPGCLTLQPAVPQSAPVSDCFTSAWPAWSNNSVFLTTPLDVPGASAFLRLTNCGCAPVTLTGLTITGPDANEYYVSGLALTGVADFDTLKSGDSRVFSINFAPLLPDLPGCKYARLEISGTGLDQPAVADLDGVAVLAPSSISAEVNTATSLVNSLSPTLGPNTQDLLVTLTQINNTISRISALLSQNNHSQAANSKNAAINQAGAFLNKVAALTRAGVLSSSQAAQLTTEGNILVEFIELLTF
jgi:hypothetical protein